MKNIDLRRVDLNLLHIFEAIYQFGNVSQAAAQLGMSQPTVSNALNRLRQQFDDPLFVRAERGVAPTVYSKMLIEPVRQALGTLRNSLALTDSFDPATARRQFRIAMNHYSIPILLPDILRQIDSADGAVQIEVTAGEDGRIIEDLNNDLVDLVVDVLPWSSEGVTFEPVAKVEAVGMARKGHPLIDGELTREAFIASGHLIQPQPTRVRMAVEGILLAARIQRRVVCTAQSALEVPYLVGATDLIAIAPRRFAEVMAKAHNLQVLPLPFDYPPQPIFIGMRTDRKDDVGLQWLKKSFTSAMW